MSPEYESLVNSLIKDGYLKTPEIIETFKAIDRINFVPEEYKSDSYVNAPLPIGLGQTISQPFTVAFMLELLEPKVCEKILDIGAGSGWQTAILAYIVSQNCKRETGRVFGIERLSELREFAEKNVAKYNFIEKGIAKIICADGSNGYKDEAPYDKIIAAAASEGSVPESWRKQLKIGGRLVAPVDHSVIVIDKIGKNKYSQKEYYGFSFVPLIKD